MECKYCGKILATKESLARHQKTIKYCLLLQDKTVSQFKCDGCCKSLSNKYSLAIHQKTCKAVKLSTAPEESKDQIIEHLREKIIEKDIALEKLESRIRELELDMKDVALKSKGKTTITTNIQQNFTPITDEKLAEDSKKLTLAHLAGGGEKIAGIFLDGSLKNNAICTDLSRKILHLKDGDGKLIKDVNAGIITKRAFTSMIEIAREIKNKCGQDIDTNDDDQIEKFGKVMSVFGEIFQAISGQTNEVSTDFAKAVCIGSVS
jgi:hypothetical protein